uniref:NADH dehydrogenase subunit 2 n=1 Tax=Orientabia sinica TaxID=2714596 RepID=UPI002237C3FE|nr:NADH dehydrogenase subunit 2 [Orientabia sinica]UYK52040.1 NADH dehydrogenase subunit 2 [Orientabia sinica]
MKIFNLKHLKQSKLNLLFFIMLMFSIIITSTSTSWISAWMGMEINLMTFIPLMMMKNKLFKSSNSMMTYFMIQASSSCMLLFLIMMYKMEMNFFKMNFINMMIQISLLMKLGAAPFHWWTPKIINLLNWKNCFILLTWQKINPMIMISMTKISNLIYYSIILSTIIGAILGLNQTSLKLLITYSSINHISWLLISLMMNFSIFIMYFLIYLISLFMICMMLNNLNIKFLNQLMKNNNQNMPLKINTLMMFLSLSGIPPLLGFFAKFKVLILMINNQLLFESILFILFSLIILSYYLNPMISIMMLNNMTNKWTMKKSNYKNMMFMILLMNLTLSMLMIMPLSQN